MGDSPKFRQYYTSGAYSDGPTCPEWTADTAAIVALQWLLDTSGDAYHALKEDLDA